jgi:predicted short-subunit dehydrogenase-like oxidoreductase (DUF2520 family)
MEVVCIGSGNVATHLAKAFKASGSKLVQVYSPNETHAAALAAELKSAYTHDLKQLYREADLYLIAVKDDAIRAVAATLNGVEGMVVHTSGATPIEVLAAAGLKHYGVFYPLQTFSKTRALEFERVPLCLEANSPENLQRLKQIAGALSTMVYEVSGEQRKILHLSAVFACNFVNHLYDLGRGILKEHQLDFELLRPLILETAEKVQSALPMEVQTGPAVRDDQETMTRHLALLENRPDLQEIYKILSNGIKKTHT